MQERRNSKGYTLQEAIALLGRVNASHKHPPERKGPRRMDALIAAKVASKTTSGCVYFLRSLDGQFVKVGFSRSLNQRLGQLAAATPFLFEHVGFRPFDDAERALQKEQRAHKALRKCRAKVGSFNGSTEWLNLNGKTRAYILRHFDMHI